MSNSTNISEVLETYNATVGPFVRLAITLLLVIAGLSVFLLAIVLASVKFINRRDPVIKFTFSLITADLTSAALNFSALLMNSTNIMPDFEGIACLRVTVEALRLAILFTELSHVALLSVLHFCAVARPVKYKEATRYVVHPGMVTIWLMPAMGSLLIHGFIIMMSYPDLEDMCGCDYFASDMYRFTVVFVFAAPMVVTVCFYLVTFQRMSTRFLNVRRNTLCENNSSHHNVSLLSNNNSPHMNNNNTSISKNHDNHGKQFVITPNSSSVMLDTSDTSTGRFRKTLRHISSMYRQNSLKPSHTSRSEPHELMNNRVCYQPDNQLEQDAPSNNYSTSQLDPMEHRLRVPSTASRLSDLNKTYVNTPMSSVRGSGSSHSKERQRMKRRHKTLQFTLIIFWVFFLSWAPSVIWLGLLCQSCAFSQLYLMQHVPWLLAVGSFLVNLCIYLKYPINAFLYALRMPNVQVAMTAMLEYFVAKVMPCVARKLSHRLNHHKATIETTTIDVTHTIKTNTQL